MNSVFGVYVRLGFEHLLDLQGADHILFIAVLCVAYSLAEWRSLLVLITAFTVGHSVSLALATLGAVRVDTGVVEFLIPVTIVAAAVLNIWTLAFVGPGGRGVEDEPKSGSPKDDSRRRAKYVLALAFGLIHGLGFSNFLRLLLGDEGRLFAPLLSFNVGLELAQIVVAVAVLALAGVATRIPRMNQRVWAIGISLIIGVTAAAMALGRWPL